MNYVVSARKYRPQRFSEVVGQDHVAQTLRKELETGKVAHAFLFCGPRGVGKTTCARILAKALNCERLTADFEPCGECSNCKSFQVNASFNIFELDAASNNSVENMRSLVEQVRVPPQQGRYRVFIIDEVHMLSQAAFNAFLKTLEEPPPHVIFILATTEKHKILPTILSRCQVFDFKRISVADIVAHLNQICQREQLEADPEALRLIAQKADGALRDALSIFDRMVSAAGKRLTYQVVSEHLNVLDQEYYFRTVDTLLVQDLPSLMQIFEEVVHRGFDGDVFITGLAEHLRNLLWCKFPQLKASIEASDELRERYAAQAARSDTAFLLTALNLCNECDVNYRMARNKRLHVEIYLVKMCHVNLAVELAREQANSTQEKKTPELKSPSGGNSRTSKVGGPEKKKSPDTIAVQAPTPQAEATGQTGTPAGDDTASASEPPEVHDSEPAQDYLNEPVKPEELPTAPSTRPEDPPAERAAKPHSDGVEPPPAEKPRKKPLRKPRNGVHAIRSLEEVSQEVEEELQKEKGRSARLNAQAFEEEWKAYLAQVQSRSVLALLNAAEAHLEGDVVCVTVGSSLAESAIRQETGLMEFLRERLHAPQLTLRISVDPEKRATQEQAPRPMTDSEKYQLMKAVNPLVDELRRRLNLRFDQ